MQSLERFNVLVNYWWHASADDQALPSSALDCLLHGAPTIVNAHGAIAELPDSVVIALPEDLLHADGGFSARY